MKSLLSLLVCVTLTSSAFAGGVAIIDTVLTDDGDGDGFADTRETVQLAITVQNTSGVALEDVTARLVTDDPQLVCILQPVISIGDLAVGQVKPVPTPFVLTVPSVDRTLLGLGPFDPLTAHFRVLIDSAPYPVAHPRKLALDLDLDVSGGSGPTSFFETFESETLGAFEIENLDQGQGTTASSDGFRCQYSDPDNPDSNISGHPQSIPDCHLGNSLSHADAVFWGLSGPSFSPLGGRAFTGFNSLFYGFDFGPDSNWTTPVANLESVRTSAPIHLGWDGMAHTLSFKHQASFADSLNFGLPPGLSYDRAVVLAQLADGTGAPAGPWIKLHPYWNVYDQQAAYFFFNCTFDPIDDGSTEDDLYPPTDPNHISGPSSTCYPEYAFVRQGETSSPFAAANVGKADGPGLAGVWGIGTWIESKFDLERFRGRSIRLRFLASTIEVNSSPAGLETWAEFLNFQPAPGEDGWWIDDVSVTGALTTAAVVTVDIHDNSGLSGLPPDSDDDSDGSCDTMDNCALFANADQADADNDGAGDLCDPCPDLAFVPDPDSDGHCLSDDNCPSVTNADQTNGDNDPAGLACDCNDADPETYPGASEVNDGVDNQCAGDTGHGLTDEISGTAGFFDPTNKDKFSWPAQPGATRYQVARALSPDFTVGCGGLPPVNVPSIIDMTPVPPGAVHHYLVRARLPITGSWGESSQGVARTVLCLP